MTQFWVTQCVGTPQTVNHLRIPSFVCQHPSPTRTVATAAMPPRSRTGPASTPSAADFDAEDAAAAMPELNSDDDGDVGGGGLAQPGYDERCAHTSRACDPNRASQPAGSDSTASDVDIAAVSLVTLPVEVIERVGSLLGDPASLGRLGLTCTTMAAILLAPGTASDGNHGDGIWRAAFLERWGWMAPCKPDRLRWRDMAAR